MGDASADCGDLEGYAVDMPYLRGLGMSLHVVAFAGLISLLAAALFASAPVLRLPWRSCVRG